MNVHKFISSLILVTILVTQMWAQKGEIIPLSSKVGTEIDAVENEILGLFPDITGFHSAQFYEMNPNSYLVKIVYMNQANQQTVEKRMNWEDFYALKRIADLHSVISEEMRSEQSDKLSYHYAIDLIKRVPQSTFCTIKLSTEKKISGSFVNYKNNNVLIQTSTSRIRIPIENIELFIYRIHKIGGNELQIKMVTSLITVLIGLGFAELWNLQSIPHKDIAWHNRFVGATMGILMGRVVFEGVRILTSPKKIIAFTPRK
ncbi:MAG: hypothetical protein H8E82_05465, partial [Candidatus Marinimicrobia bacterium]|nr:hypothetical protein [Candidatus Neomarinimicrobiota bacterium]